MGPTREHAITCSASNAGSRSRYSALASASAFPLSLGDPFTTWRPTELSATSALCECPDGLTFASTVSSYSVGAHFTAPLSDLSSNFFACFLFACCFSFICTELTVVVEFSEVAENLEIQHCRSAPWEPRATRPHLSIRCNSLSFLYKNDGYERVNVYFPITDNEQLVRTRYISFTRIYVLTTGIKNAPGRDVDCNGGEAGIRTLVTGVAGKTVFETAAFNRSATSPQGG